MEKKRDEDLLEANAKIQLLFAQRDQTHELATWYKEKTDQYTRRIRKLEECLRTRDKQVKELKEQLQAFLHEVVDGSDFSETEQVTKHIIT